MLIRAIALLLVATAIAVSVFVATLPFPCNPEENGGGNAQTAEQHTYKDCPSAVSAIFTPLGRFIHTYKDEIGATSGALLAFITAGLIFIGYLQIVTTRAQLRAYISVQPGGSARQSQRRHSRFEFVPNVVNDGQTPANDVIITSRLEFITSPIPPDFNFSMPAPMAGASVTSIGSKQLKLHNNVYRRDLTFAELRQLHKRTAAFHIWGHVTYRDIFKINRQTNFSFIVYVPRKSVPCNWFATDRHNDSE